MIKLPKPLNDLRAKFYAKFHERTDIQIKGEQARRDLDNALQRAIARRAELGRATVEHARHGGQDPEALRQSVGADQMFILTLTAMNDGYQAEEAKLTEEIAAGKPDLHAAVTSFHNAAKDANSQNFSDVLQELVTRLKPIYATARGLRNDRVLHSLREALLPVNGRNIFHEVRAWEQADEAMKAIASEWSDLLTEMNEEINQN
jgi:hypothetical protein